MNFGDALMYLKGDRRITRSIWKSTKIWIAIQKPDAKSAHTQPYIYMITSTGEHVPWIPSHIDILANDWLFANSEHNDE